ncbi:ribosome maturation factor RimM [Halobacteriovorax sp. JY17]|uniref:ribosome maturation factor RimM n=1 Tax=Halobacteriovorax sp. JY17 TaxID=2014617 RepID=UPI000C3FCF15|nr:ribosome maturation factor RimM [Halobacteriovorax sp. JY17]PIK15849.1 MAG: 16S rRNA processing protein RimM [Halobacteriovorax sp. JY17]
MKNEQLVEMGFCAKPHGIKGGFTFNLSNLEDSVLKKKTKVILFPKNGNSSLSEKGETYTIQSIAFGNKVIVYLEEVTDRNKVEEIIPFEVYVERNLFPDPEDDEFYISDLVGLEVRVNGLDEVYGKISSFYDNSAQIVLVVKGAGNQVQELPFIEEFFPEVNIEEGYLTMILPSFIEGEK